MQAEAEENRRALVRCFPKWEAALELVGTLFARSNYLYFLLPKGAHPVRSLALSILYTFYFQKVGTLFARSPFFRQRRFDAAAHLATAVRLAVRGAVVNFILLNTRGERSRSVLCTLTFVSYPEYSDAVVLLVSPCGCGKSRRGSCYCLVAKSPCYDSPLATPIRVPTPGTITITSRLSKRPSDGYRYRRCIGIVTVTAATRAAPV